MKYSKWLLSLFCVSFVFSGCVLKEKMPEIQKAVRESQAQYKVILEDVDSFEETPVLYFDKGYVVKVNGLYGFIDNEGEYLYEPVYHDPFVISTSEGSCLFLREEDGMGVDVETGVRSATGVGGPNVGWNYFTPDGQMREQGLGVSREITPEKSIILFPGEGDGLDVDLYGDYYIYSVPEQTMFGPYSHSEYACFSAKVSITDEGGFYGGWGHPMLPISTLFCEKTDGGYKIHNAQTGDCLDTVFDSAEPLSEDSFLVTIGGEKGIVNKDCELVICGDFEDVSEPLDGKAYVRVDGKWLLVHID